MNKRLEILVEEPKAKFRNVDNLQGSVEIRKRLKNFSKRDFARRMEAIIEIENNRSVSFGHFITGLRGLLNE